ncbi:MAG TPA: hypothetical protein VHX44_02385 [Planctomycetota bacterium]|jgi:hypothetical protein|nr:hypothetical protein [Planctomycetota bacterium]
MLPDADPIDLLTAFLAAHAKVEAVPAMLYVRGEELYHRLNANPPADPTWGRFLVALGQLAAETMDDAPAASRYFLHALQGVAKHGDYEAAVTAGYNQGVLQERRRHMAHALAAYQAAAREGFRCGAITANTLRAATAAVRLRFAEDGDLGDLAPLAKQAWLGWLWLRLNDPTQLDAALVEELTRQLAALLLPEDDPGLLMARWRSWAPSTLALPDGRTWTDGDPACRDGLFAAAAEAADAHLADETQDPGAPYRILRAAARRIS